MCLFEIYNKISIKKYTISHERKKIPTLNFRWFSLHFHIKALRSLGFAKLYKTDSVREEMDLAPAAFVADADFAVLASDGSVEAVGNGDKEFIEVVEGETCLGLIYLFNELFLEQTKNKELSVKLKLS